METVPVSAYRFTYAWRESEHDTPFIDRRVGIFTLENGETVDAARISISKTLGRDPALATEVPPELWSCDPEGVLTLDVNLSSIEILKWTFTECDARLFDMHPPKNRYPCAVLVFTFPRSATSVQGVRELHASPLIRHSIPGGFPEQLTNAYTSPRPSAKTRTWYYDPSTEALAKDPRMPIYDVFLSHSGTEKRNIVSFLLKSFNSFGLEVFIDHNMRPGSKATKEMLHAAQYAKIGVFVLTTEFFDEDREWTYKELLIFLDRVRDTQSTERAIIVPIFYTVGPGTRNADNLTDLARSLLKEVSTLVGVEFRKEFIYEEPAVTQLAEAVAKMVDSPVVSFLNTGTDTMPNLGVSRTADTLPSKLLVSRFEVVPFHGRQELLAELMKWCDFQDGNERLSAKVLHGPGGIGKTRLMIELIKRLRTNGLSAGFLNKSATLSEFKTLVNGVVRGTVVVIDYAESWPELRQLLSYLAERISRIRAGWVRVLLLSRNDGDWLKSLRTDEILIDKLLNDDAVQAVPRVADVQEDRSTIFKEAMKAFAKRLDVAVPYETTPDLSGQTYNRTLYIHMAALATLFCLEFTPGTLLTEIIKHEERIWRNELCHETMSEIVLNEKTYAFKILVTAIAMRGGTKDRGDLAAVSKPLDLNSRLPNVFPLLHQFYAQQSDSDAISAIEPDIFAESLICSTLVGLGDDGCQAFLDSVFGDSDTKAISHAFEILGRMSADQPVGTVSRWVSLLLNKEPKGRAMLALNAVLANSHADDADVRLRATFTEIGQLLANYWDRNGTLEDARVVSRMVPSGSYALADVAVWATKALINNGQDGDCVPLLLSLAIWEHQLGRYRDCIHSAERAASSVKRCTKNEFSDFGILATAYYLIGLAHESEGGYDAAISATKTSLDYLLVIKDLNKQSYINYSKMIERLAMLHSNYGNIENAIGLIKKAVLLPNMQGTPFESHFSDLIDRWLATAMTRAQHPHDLAADLQIKEELQKVSSLRVSASADPDVNLPALASALHHLASVYYNYKNWKAALDAANESVSLFSPLAFRFPEAFNEKLLEANETRRLAADAFSSRRSANSEHHRTPSEVEVGNNATTVPSRDTDHNANDSVARPRGSSLSFAYNATGLEHQSSHGLMNPARSVCRIISHEAGRDTLTGTGILVKMSSQEVESSSIFGMLMLFSSLHDDTLLPGGCIRFITGDQSDSERLKLPLDDHRFRFACPLLNVAFVEIFESDSFFWAVTFLRCCDVNHLFPISTRIVSWKETRWETRKAEVTCLYGFVIVHGGGPSGQSCLDALMVDEVGSFVGIPNSAFLSANDNQKLDSAVSVQYISSAIFTAIEYFGRTYDIRAISVPRTLTPDETVTLDGRGLRCLSNSFVFLKRPIEPVATALWFYRSNHGWYWTPVSPPKIDLINLRRCNWSKISKNDPIIAIGGSVLYSGSPPASANVACIEWLISMKGQFVK